MKCTGRFLILLFLSVTLASAEILNKGWWKDTVFYQIYPRSYMDSDNDGVGDLKGIIKKLDHIKDAGIGAVWLSPINTSPMVDFGYDISDFKDIDATFGTIKDFEDLVAYAKKINLKVILDLVPNHSSDQHYWFQQSLKGIGKYKDYYVWTKGKEGNKKPPNNWLSVFSGPAWTYVKSRDEWYLHQFEYRQPDLNFTNPDVRREMEDIILYWLDKGVDGFRVDSATFVYEADLSENEPRSYAPGVASNHWNYLIHNCTLDQPKSYELIQSWRNLLDDYANKHNHEEKVLMTEVYTNLLNTTKYYNYGSHIPFNFNFIIDVNATSSATDFKNVIDKWMNAMPKNAVANWVIGNHDRRRVASRYLGRADQMTMLTMILPGVGVTYNGEEIGMVDNNDITFEETKDPQGILAGKENYKKESRDPCRTPFQWDNTTNAGFSGGNGTWLPINKNYKELNLKKQKEAAESHYKLYQSLTSMRKTSKALKDGDLKTIVLKNEILAVVRNEASEVVTLLINFSNTTKHTVDLSKIVPSGESVVKLRSVGANVSLNKPVKLSSIEVPEKASIVVVTKVKVGSNSAMKVSSKYYSPLMTASLAMLYHSNS